MNCQYHRLYDREEECENASYANITVAGDKDSLTIDICEEHLNELASFLPVTESKEACAQRTA